VPTRVIPKRLRTLGSTPHYFLTKNHTKGWGSVRFEFTDDDQIEDTQRDTHVPAGTCCLGTPELASSKMEVVSRGT
jgi:hypothetical protein